MIILLFLCLGIFVFLFIIVEKVSWRLHNDLVRLFISAVFHSAHFDLRFDLRLDEGDSEWVNSVGVGKTRPLRSCRWSVGLVVRLLMGTQLVRTRKGFAAYVADVIFYSRVDFPQMPVQFARMSKMFGTEL